MEQNPLQKFYRAPKFTVALPSRGQYYPPDGSVVDLNSDYEVNILPMTAQDEIVLKDPNMLLSGEAITKLIKSCVPVVKKPRDLLNCDVEAIMIGIRAASYGDVGEFDTACPKCSYENRYEVNYSSLVETATPLNSVYDVVLSNGVTVYVTPSTFDLTVRQNRTLFEAGKIQRLLEDDEISEEAKLKLFSDSFNKANQANFELIVASIDHVEYTDDDGQVKTVKQKKFIAEFLNNIDKAEADKIIATIEATNNHGIIKTQQAVCKECLHEWEIPIEFNETNFS